MNNRELIDTFLMQQKLSAAPRTYEYYKENLARFYDYCSRHYFNIPEGGEPQEIPFSEYDKYMYMNYLTYLKETGIKNVSLHTYHRAVRTFCNWMLEEQFIKSAFTNVKLPRTDPAPIHPLTLSEVDRIDKIVAYQVYHNRNYCMIHLMLDCGLRLQEVINLDKKDFYNEPENAYVMIVNSKFNRSRVVPVPRFLADRMASLARENRYDYFFESDNKRISKSVLKNIFRKLKVKADIPRLHAHLLRHTFATSYIAGGGNLEYLRLLLGHADYNITQKYLHISMQSQIVGMDIYRLDKCFFRNYNNM